MLGVRVSSPETSSGDGVGITESSSCQTDSSDKVGVSVIPPEFTTHMEGIATSLFDQ